MKKNSARNGFLLFLAACIWGMAFVSQSKGMDYMGPLTFNGVRALIGAVVLFLYLLLTRKMAGEKKKPIDWKIALPGGIFCGIALTSASILQQYGIMNTTVGKAGFITTLYIIFVPILGIFLRRKVPFMVWIAACLAAYGMYLLCMTESLRLGSGDIMVFVCAIIFAVHILIIDHYSPKTDGVVLSFLQFLICGIVSTLGALIWEHPQVEQLIVGAGPLLYAGVMSCGIAYTLQIVGQKDINPTVAALILSMESVVATVAAYIAYRIGFLQTDQTLDARQIIGCVIVFAAVILAQLPQEWFSKIARKRKIGE